MIKDFFLKTIENHPVLVSIIITAISAIYFAIKFVKQYFLKNKIEYPASIKIRLGMMNVEASLGTTDDRDKEDIERAKSILKIKGHVESYAYFCDVPDDSYIFVNFFYGISNEENATAAAKGVSILLEYPKENIIVEDTVLNFKDEHVVLMQPPLDIKFGNSKYGAGKYYKSRQVVFAGEKAIVSYEIPFIRPGEGIMINEGFKIRKSVGNRADRPLIESGVRPTEVIEKLLEIKNFIDYFKVKIYVSSENSKREKTEANIYCFQGTSSENIPSTIQAIDRIFLTSNNKIFCVWNPPLFKSVKVAIPGKIGGWIWLPPIGSVGFYSELIEVIIPHLEKKLDGRIYFENDPFKAERDWVSFTYHK
jgi:hypothetical protein